MNILPLVSAFILLFAIGSYTFLHQFRAAVHEEKSYTERIALSQKNARDKTRRAFNRIKAKESTPKKPKGEKTNKENIAYKSPRDRRIPFPEGKLNITFLFKKEENPQIKTITLELIERLYEFTSLEFDAEHLLDTLIATVKKHPSIDTFEKLLSHLPPEEAPIFYKLVKGTNTYTLFTSEGYPPIGNFITLDPKSHQRPIHFAHASRPLLQALFGDVFAPQIVKEERHKWEPEHKHLSLKKDELEALLLQHRKNLVDYEQLLNFSTGRKATE